jgi:hypothetical protein
MSFMVTVATVIAAQGVVFVLYVSSFLFQSALNGMFVSECLISVQSSNRRP